MIRFACPGCSTTFSVGDDRAGKITRCPKCQTKFVIPEPEPAAAAAPPPSASAPPPLPPATDEPVEIAPCPSCDSRLSVMPADLGSDVECPSCQTVFKAKKLSSAALGPRRRLVGQDADDNDTPALRRRRRDEDEEDEDERPRRGQRRDEEEDEEEERPRRRRRRRASYEPHRGTTILILGILSLTLCGVFTGIPAVIMGGADLKKMDQGIMDPEGRTMTMIGRILGLINVGLTAIVFLFYCLMFAVFGLGAAGGGR